MEERYQVRPDGALDRRPTKLIEPSRKKEILSQLFSQNGWSCKILSIDRSKFQIEVSNASASRKYALNVFLGSIRDESRSPKEMKIQLNGLDPRGTEDGMTNIILGVYCYQEEDKLQDLVFAGWSIDIGTNYPSNPSLRGINTDLIQQAKIYGFVKNKAQRTDVSIFRPEFIFYYLRSIELAPARLVGERDDPAKVFTGHLQKIFYGAPGTGKSRNAFAYADGKEKTITAFHPDTDYSSFVGCYKPVGREAGIAYEFIPQAFAKAYVAAWKAYPAKEHVLIIEEINRGNCAQIFGDIFQLLDRDEDGFSQYVIDADNDFAEYIRSELSGVTAYQEKLKELIGEGEEFSYNKIALPSNLSVLATMNTSDQSLFPMDSAFKRRWEWEYVPIDIEDARAICIDIEGTAYSWGDFIQRINEKIREFTSSEDKLLGNRFVRAADNIITLEQFKSKVLFYLWSEIYKDEQGSSDSIFRVSSSEAFSFSDLFKEDSISRIRMFLEYNGVTPLPKLAPDEVAV